MFRSFSHSPEQRSVVASQPTFRRWITPKLAWIIIHFYHQKKKVEELAAITEELKLKPEETKTFIENSFRDGALRTTGTDIDKILPPTSRFGGGNRSEVKKNVIQRLTAFFERYFGV